MFSETIDFSREIRFCAVSAYLRAEVGVDPRHGREALQRLGRALDRRRRQLDRVARNFLGLQERARTYRRHYANPVLIRCCTRSDSISRSPLRSCCCCYYYYYY